MVGSQEFVSPLCVWSAPLHCLDPSALSAAGYVAVRWSGLNRSSLGQSSLAVSGCGGRGVPLRCRSFSYYPSIDGRVC
ncbi:unnamed protein product [Macrosiphum euphorbiae]|uniref:Uncharacterized protein n=1 Tax=Macrosiphum euphorbiae TaxID=13131 RepID=A0AAV0XUQ1_9HEMI|nr:unnamed protein product [Macrosiphum euphorbiae]